MSRRISRPGRFSKAPLCSLVVAAALAASAADARGPLLPSRVTPVLSGNAEARARAILLARDPSLASVELRLLDTRAVGVGGAFTMVRFSQQAGDLPVLGRGARVLLTKDLGATALVTADVAEIVRALPAATLSAEEAAKAASEIGRVSFSASDGRLVAYPLLDGARVAYVFYRGLIPGTARAPLVVVDAITGRRLGRTELGRQAKQAKLFVPNPVTAKLATDVVLDLPDNAKTLENGSFLAKSCVDKGKVVDTGQGFELHVCDFEAKAAADANGDFLYTMPPKQEPDDAFAEVSAFYHTTRASTYLRELGMPEVKGPFLIVANFRVAGGDLFTPSSKSDPLGPYANAFYAPADPAFEFLFDIKKAGLFLGQAEKVDFSYDGDVVYHEFGHAMVDLTAKLDGEWKLDEQGAVPSPGAMNEGIADTVSSWIAGDPNVGEYGSEEGGVGESSIRNIENTRRCPDDLVGEVHQDSLYFSGALWAARRDAFADPVSRKLFETAVVTALLAAPTGNLGYEELVELLVTALAASKVGDDKIAGLRKAFADRGFGPVCKRVFEWSGAPIGSSDESFFNFFFMPGLPNIKLPTAPYAPGLFQIHAKLPPNIAKVDVDWESYPYPSEFGGGQPSLPQVVVRYGSEPITFKPKGSFGSTGEDPVDAKGPKSRQGHFKAVLDVPEGETEAWIMLVNGGDEDVLYGQVELGFVKGKPLSGKGGAAGSGSAGAPPGAAGNGPGSAGAATRPSGGSPGAGSSANVLSTPAQNGTSVPSSSDGCGCTIPGSTTPAPGVGLVALAAALLATRRRPSRSLRALK